MYPALRFLVVMLDTWDGSLETRVGEHCALDSEIGLVGWNACEIKLHCFHFYCSSSRA